MAKFNYIQSFLNPLQVMYLDTIGDLIYRLNIRWLKLLSNRETFTTTKPCQLCFCIPNSVSGSCLDSWCISCFLHRMQVKPSTQPVIVSIPICHYDGQSHFIIYFSGNTDKRKKKTPSIINHDMNLFFLKLIYCKYDEYMFFWSARYDYSVWMHWLPSQEIIYYQSNCAN